MEIISVVERTARPRCLGSVFQKIYECNFSLDPIRQHLKDFYEPQGGVEFAHLEGATFVLQQCRICSLIFQGQIGNDFLLRISQGSTASPDASRAL